MRIRPTARIGLLPAMALVAGGWLAATARADPVTLQAAIHDGVGRLVFSWPSPVDFETTANDGRLVIRFDRPIEADYRSATKILGRCIGAAEAGTDSRSVVFPLAPGVAAFSFASKRTVVADFLNINPSRQASTNRPKGTMAKRDAPAVRLQTSEHPGFSRLAVEWLTSVDYRIGKNASTATIVFDRPGKVDSSRIVGKALRYVQRIAVEAEDNPLKLTLTVNEASRIVDTRNGSKVLIDVQAPAVEGSGHAERNSPGTQSEGKELDVRPEPKTTVPSTGVASAGPPAPTANPSSQPPPAPNAASLRFDWPEPVAAAVFRRGGSLWVVFDRASPQDVRNLRVAGGPALHQIEQRFSARATVLRMITADGVNPSVRRDGLSWILEFRQQPLTAETPIKSRAEPAAEANERLFLPIAEPGDPIVLDDPDAGDRLVMIPVIPLGHGLSREYRYPEATLLASAQGVVIRPLIDALRVRSSRDGVALNVDGGLRVSSVPDSLRVSAQTGVSPRPGPLFNLGGWESADDLDSFLSQKQTLERAVIDVPETGRELARLDLARFFLAHAHAAEALGALRLIAEARPEIEREATFRALRGASRFLMGRFSEAEEDLFHQSLDGSDEGTLWRTALIAAEGGIPENPADFRRLAATALIYPNVVRTPLVFLLAEAAIEAGETDRAAGLLDGLRLDALGSVAQGRLAYLQGRLLEAKGDADGALAQ